MRKVTDHWLDARLRELPGKSQAGLARLLNVPSPRISELKTGVWQLPSLQVQRAARYLEWTTDLLLEKMAGHAEAIEHQIDYSVVVIRGEVAAGIWVESWEWPAEEWLTVHVPKTKNDFQGVPVYGVRVVGDSMNLKFPNGTILECVKYIDIDRQPQSGEYVVVHRRNSNGDYECTVKRFRKDENGKAWLLPESDKPEFQGPLFVNGSGEDDEVVVYARVIRAHLDV